jgi:hypothetical protein
MTDILVWSRAVLQTTPERWLRLGESLPVELLTLPPAPKEWSALECLQHLVDTEKTVFAARVKFLLAGQDFPAFDPDSQGTRPDLTQPPLELAHTFNTMRQESLALMAQLSEADLERRARHQELGPVTLRELLHEWAGHDLMHTVQAERALLQPFIRGCGPWQKYFADHLIKSG